MQREIHRDLPRETETARENQRREVRSRKQHKDSRRDLERPSPTKGKETETGVSEKGEAGQQQTATGRVTEMQPPPGAEVPREASAGKGSAMGTDRGGPFSQRHIGTWRERTRGRDRDQRRETPSRCGTSDTWLHLAVPQLLCLCNGDTPGTLPKCLHRETVSSLL